ncbi:hypothetical protein ZIOFF_018091 [Zingiber officinale]|uniref:Uncharacterized protein n=1 Tax=Zingiber officinale TaxID=94328 RepID=A0A8J5LQ53_ZINOF|nr:hypothetical protein ZIOFF_018091 [Zingiber officinale]
MEVAQCFVSLAFAVHSHRSRVALISRASFELGSTEKSARTSGSLLEEKGRVSATRRGRRSACLGMDRLNCKSKVAPGNRSFSRKNRDREDISRSCAALAAFSTCLCGASHRSSEETPRVLVIICVDCGAGIWQPPLGHCHNVVRQRLDFASENQSADEHPKEAFMESKSVIKEKYNTATNSRAKITVQLGEGLEVEGEESEADIAFDLNRSNNQVPDMHIRLPEYPTPIYHSRRELLKKNWKHLARMAGKANSTDKTHIVEISKQSSIQSHVKLDGDTTLVRGEMENEQAKSCYNHVDNGRRGSIYPISGDKGSTQTHASNIPQFPPECKRRRTMLMHNVEFGQMTRVSKSCSFVDEQNLVPLGDLQTSDFMLTFGPIKWVTKKRS